MVIVREMFGIIFDNRTSTEGRVQVKKGLLSLANWNNNQSIRGNSNLDIEKGKVIIRYWRLDLANTCDPGRCAQDGRITGYKNAKFDKKINVEGGNPNNAQNDIINNVVFTWDAANNQTILTAIHPVQPSPALDAIVSMGDVTLEWNNWDPNKPGDQIVVDIWLGTEPNKLSPNYTKVVSGLNVTGQARSSVILNVPAAGTYYWQVDTNNGVEQEDDIFTFEATDNLPPAVDAGPGFITWVGQPVQLNAAVTDENTPVLSWTSAPAANASFSNAAVEDPTAVFAAVGTYTLTLTADDGFNPPVSDTLIVNVYGDACEAARTGTNNRPATDIVVDCVIDLEDFAQIASNWLLDYALAAPVNN